jgi:hypothetical protein
MNTGRDAVAIIKTEINLILKNIRVKTMSCISLMTDLLNKIVE